MKSLSDLFGCQPCCQDRVHNFDVLGNEVLIAVSSEHIFDGHKGWQNSTELVERPIVKTEHGSYTGQWLGSNMHGKGKLERDDGSLYEGALINGKAHGRGRFKLPREMFMKENGIKTSPMVQAHTATLMGRTTTENGSRMRRAVMGTSSGQTAPCTKGNSCPA